MVQGGSLTISYPNCAGRKGTEGTNLPTSALWDMSGSYTPKSSSRSTVSHMATPHCKEHGLFWMVTPLKIWGSLTVGEGEDRYWAVKTPEPYFLASIAPGITHGLCLHNTAHPAIFKPCAKSRLFLYHFGTNPSWLLMAIFCSFSFCSNKTCLQMG